MGQESKIEIVPYDPGWPAAFEVGPRRGWRAIPSRWKHMLVPKPTSSSELSPWRSGVDIPWSQHFARCHQSEHIAMNSATRPVAAIMAGAVALLLGSVALSSQTTIDVEDSYPNVGAIMVWRVDDAGKPVQLRGFASGTLIRSRVMLTAGHFTAPTKAMGEMPPTLRAFASFSPTDARNPGTWIPVVAQATHPSMPHCPPPPHCDPTEDILVAPLEPGIAELDWYFSNVRRPTSNRPCSRRRAPSIDPKELAR